MTEPHSQSQTRDDDQAWEPCARGTITGMVKNIKKHRQQRALREIALAAGCILISVLLANEFLTPPAQLTHSQVVELSQDFIDGTLPPSMVALVEKHISVCPRCEHLLEARDREQGQSLIVLPDQTVVSVDVPAEELFVAAH